MPKLKEESCKASTLHNELQLTNECGERRNSDKLSTGDQCTFFGHHNLRFWGTFDEVSVL